MFSTEQRHLLILMPLSNGIAVFNDLEVQSDQVFRIFYIKLILNFEIDIHKCFSTSKVLRFRRASDCEVILNFESAVISKSQRF